MMFANDLNNVWMRYEFQSIGIENYANTNIYMPIVDPSNWFQAEANLWVYLHIGNINLSISHIQSLWLCAQSDDRILNGTRPSCGFWCRYYLKYIVFTQSFRSGWMLDCHSGQFNYGFYQPMPNSIFMRVCGKPIQIISRLVRASSFKNIWSMTKGAFHTMKAWTVAQMEYSYIPLIWL